MFDVSSILPHSARSEIVFSEAVSSVELKAWWPLQVVPLIAVVFAIFSFIVLRSPLWLMIGLSLPIIVSGFYSWQRLPATSRFSVSALQWRDGVWRLRFNKKWHDAELSDVVIWSGWLFLQFKISGQWLPVKLPLCRQHFYSESDWRALRRFLHE